MSFIITVPPVTAPAKATERYAIIPGSDSGHCCFEFTVVDMYNSKEQTYTYTYKDEKYWEYAVMCECFDLESASKVCEALNYVERMTLD